MTRLAALFAGLLALSGVMLVAQPTDFKPDSVPTPPDVAAPPRDAARTGSGLATKVLQPGTGTVKPTADDFVTVTYTGWTAKGKLFDSSFMRGPSHTLPLSKTIKGWSEAVQQMVVGEKIRAWIPENIAYEGQTGRPRGMLVYDIELLDIVTSPTIAPPDVAAAPPDATITASGLAYKLLKTGPGGAKPTPNSRVTVHYTGWTTDGKMFDSSVMRGMPTTFTLGEVIDGWTEGVQLLSPGDKARFWIPENLAYKGQEGMPAGMLVFDIELIKASELR